MRSITPAKKYLAIAAAVAVTGWAGAAPVAAEPGNGNGNPGQTQGPGNSNGNGQGADKPGNGPKDDKGPKPGNGPKEDKGPKPGNGPKEDKGPKPGNGPKEDKGPKPGNGPKEDKGPKPGNGPKDDKGPKPGNGPKDDKGPKPGNGPKDDKGPKPGNGDPAGNNGTVKIAQVGEDDGIPNNNPHPGCSFQVEWYGFDEGDYWSTVTFTPQAPTSDITISGTEPSRVFVGEDPASGAGTATGLDATQVYTLSFTGEPHPKQGYHVRLTVATPFSQGNDTKTKVFWVAPCASTPVAPTPTTTPEVGSDPDEPTVDETEPATTEDNDATAEVEPGVLGIQATASPTEEAEAGVLGATAEDDDAAVPTAVDAGEDGNPVLDLVSSPLPWIVIGLGLGVAALAMVRRRQGA